MKHPRVLGVDGCASGWIGVVLDGAGGLGAYAAPAIADLVADAARGGPVQVVGIDIPVGLADTGQRQADLLARRQLGARRSSVFITPVRRAATAPNHATACAINRDLTGAGVSMQAFRLMPKVLQVDAWLREHGPSPGMSRVVEVHPELSFALLAGGDPPPPKRTWAGAQQRASLLARAGIRLTGDLGTAGRAAAVDDVLDAAAAAWTALRVARGQARSLPDPPELLADGTHCAIWT